jgi:hypothetical protein
MLQLASYYVHKAMKMLPIEEHQLRLEIELIIDRSRHYEEMFLVDSKQAAFDILLYLQQQNLLTKQDAELIGAG